MAGLFLVGLRGHGWAAVHHCAHCIQQEIQVSRLMSVEEEKRQKRKKRTPETIDKMRKAPPKYSSFTLYHWGKEAISAKQH